VQINGRRVVLSSPKQPGSQPTAIAVDLETAAGLLDLSLPTFQQHVLPQLRVMTISDRCKRIAISELERWAAESGTQNGKPTKGASDEHRP
jgi:hypothetical protein